MAAWDGNIDDVLALMAHGISANLNMGRVVAGNSSTQSHKSHLTLDRLHRLDLMLNTFENGSDGLQRSRQQVPVNELFYLDGSIRDSRYDYTYPSTGHSSQNMHRGDEAYEPPYGWCKIGLRVVGKYEDDTWLGGVDRPGTGRTDSVEGEWPVSYHGTNRDNANSMARDGYDLSKGTRFKFGNGIYSTPEPSTAEKYAKSFEYKGDDYKMMFMNRVNLNFTRVIPIEETRRGTYFVTSCVEAVRPYALLFKKLNTGLDAS